ncbi:hypothetical protein [Dactylosporangium sp. CA-139066]|uniref:hypothetical protein n=1 Tax=Dactylosporangium sp. CA-139066 TaxID=3239930 RepID=UPI003D8F8E53
MRMVRLSTSYRRRPRRRLGARAEIVRGASHDVPLHAPELVIDRVLGSGVSR